ncbi:MAG TPA: helix-turn-helix domain-containing protein [Phycisphaerae bacterium]|nr:helix-turn-helix domain-containing protein [Phycisphaerae bacterium]
MTRNRQTYWIDEQRQIAALASPLRQEIVDVVTATGPCSIARMAAALGRPPDRLYFHIRRLEAVGLLTQNGTVGNGRTAAALYDVPGRPLRIRYDRRDKSRTRAIGAVHDGVLRLARRDLKRAMASARSVVNGPLRDTWGGRSRGWMTSTQIRRLNRLIEQMINLVRSGDARKGAKPVAFTFVLAPPRQRPAKPKSIGVKK